jgi:hypothetical protein
MNRKKRKMENKWWFDQCAWWQRQLKWNDEQIIFWQDMVDKAVLHRTRIQYEQFVAQYKMLRVGAIVGYNDHRRLMRQFNIH